MVLHVVIYCTAARAEGEQVGAHRVPSPQTAFRRCSPCAIQDTDATENTTATTGVAIITLVVIQVIIEFMYLFVLFIFYR